MRSHFDLRAFTPQHLSGGSSGGNSVAHSADAVDENVFDAGRVLMWIVKCGVVASVRRVENYDIRRVSGGDSTAFCQAEPLGGQSGHSVNCRLERDTA